MRTSRPAFSESPHASSDDGGNSSLNNNNSFGQMLNAACGYSTFPVLVTRRILSRVFKDPSALATTASGSREQHQQQQQQQQVDQKDMTAGAWWQYLPAEWLDRLIAEVEMTSINNNGNSSSNRSPSRLGGAPEVNCYDCILLCWKAAATLRAQLTAILKDLFKFLLSIVPQGTASPSFHLLLTHMVTLPHARSSDLAGSATDRTHSGAAAG
jgi:hypothetical protein